MNTHDQLHRSARAFLTALVILACGFALVACEKKGYGGLDPVVIEGRVTEEGSDRGIPGVFVIANMRTYHTGGFGGHGSGGCVDGAVLETAPDGRYVFRWSWSERGEAPPDDLSIHFEFYKLGWETTVVGLLDAPQGVPKGSARMQPATKGLDPKTFRRIWMTWEHCGQDRGGPGWRRMLTHQHQELLAAICASQPDPDLNLFENWASLTHSALANLGVSDETRTKFDDLVRKHVPEAHPWYAFVAVQNKGPLEVTRREAVCRDLVVTP